MRLEGIKKAGFYALPPYTTSLIAGLLRPWNKSNQITILDSCAGNGIPARSFAQALIEQGAKSVTTYGVEISPDRAAQAKSLLDYVINDDWNNIQTSNEAYSMSYLNPPYDWEGQREDDERQERQEYLFLKSNMSKLNIGGLLIYVIPRQTLAETKVQRFLAGHLDQLTVYSFPADEYEKFKQLVIFGHRRKLDRHPDIKDNLAMLERFAKDELPPELTADSPTWTVPATGKPVDEIAFYKFSLTRDQLLDVIGESGMYSREEWREQRKVKEMEDFRPAVPMRPGHLSMLLLSGILRTMSLNDGKLLVKGRVEKREEQTYADEDEQVFQEMFYTKLFILHADGQHEVIDTEESFKTFMQTYSPEMARILETRFKPLYTSPTQEEWDKLAPLLQTKLLPGRFEAGMLDAQKHMAIATSRVLKAHKTATMVAEMGFGKSSSSASVAHLLNAYPAIVIGPAHMPEKWVEELQDTVPDIYPVIVTNIAEMRGVYEEYERKRSVGEPLPKLVVVLSLQDGKNGPGWRSATHHRTYHKRPRGSKGEKLRIITSKSPVCAHCAKIPTDEEGYPYYDKIPDNKKMDCPHCGKPMWQYYHRFDSKLQRWPVAKWIRTQLPRGWFKLLIADEVHDYKSRDTDQGQAYTDLVQACKYNLNLTGTWFGGKSKDIFYLLYRTNPQVRAEFAFGAESEWSQRFGRLQRTVKAVQEMKDGAFTGKTRYYTSTKELPGINPGIVPYILPTILFASINDLGYELPGYVEEIVRIDMTPEQEKEYRDYSDDLMAKARDASGKDKARYISVWQQTCLGRPDSIHREDKIHILDEEGEIEKKEGRTVKRYKLFRSLPPLIDGDVLSPKEQWLLETVQDEIAQGRKALIYLRQTGTRDIQPRLMDILRRHGYRPVLIPDKIKPKDRAKWIKNIAQEVDCLIVNPRKVATGLDLVQFATAIVYEIDYSLVVLWQAIRRIWRLGQIKNVKVLFAVYRDTLEESALILMGQKMRAAYNIYGSAATSALADEGGGDNIIDQITRQILVHGKIQTNGFTGLVQQEAATVSTWNKPTGQNLMRPVVVPVGSEPTVEGEYVVDEMPLEEEAPAAAPAPPKPNKPIFQPKRKESLDFFAMRQKMGKLGKTQNKKKEDDNELQLALF